ncbi:serine/arginine repetitive matrix protein 2-like isoform X6 [Bactrocera tryoni]|uniref:serine/arginine repetitive matrix protein 2-like isoform X6 n=1 Tax=Bactrocera tryoni TaxID=59916 RepID=UPI001A997325|nr:serine/arginine repetitive matrix protein 2-like isoform X6 [Bactrocera tryoni]
MLAIKECLIREGVLNLTSTSNLGNGALGDEENRVGGVGAAVAGAAATANSNNIYGNRFSDAAAVSNNLRAISANYTYNNDNRYKRYNDKMTATTAATTNTTTLALEPQLAKLRDQKSVDTTHSPNTNYENKSSNCSLSSASVTAKSSCQQTSSVYDKIKHQQQQQQQLQQQQQRQQTSKHHSKEQQQQPGTRSSSSSSTRYHGVHPHFHHHTAPAYYTDVNLHIHTPKANDVTSLNENYQSVYNTPTQLVKEHYFPKTSTATVVPPPIGTGAAVIGRASTTSPSSLEKRERERERNKVPIDSASSNNKSANTAAARAAFFRGGSAGSSGYNNGERPSHEALAKSSPAFGRPTETGELNDTTYTPYVDSGSSFVVVDINSSSDCSKYNNNNNVKPLDDNSATDITQHDSINHNYNNSNIKSITSPTSPTGTNTSTTTTSAGRSRNSHRFAGKRRAVRVRSESRPISALYDIICKEKGLDIGTSTTNEEDSSAPSNDDDAHHSARNSHNTKGKSKERSHPRSSSSRNNSLKNSKDYAEISNCLTAFVANSLSNYLGGTAYDQSNMDHAATASGDTNATHDRAKRSHKARASSGHKPGSKKRKDVGGKTKASTPRSPRDEELNGETSEDSNDAFAHTPLSARSKHRADCNRRMNGTEKAASLPPQLHVTAQHATTTTGTGMPQKATTHTNNVESNTHLNVRKKCSIHCRCQLGCECRSANSAHRTTHYPYEYHQSSLPPNLSSGTCSSVRSPSTADDESLGYSPEKLYIEPVNMNLSGISSSPANAKHANSSSSGVVLEPTSSIHSVRNTKERVSRAQQRRLREEMRRHTDLPQLDSLSPSSLSNISQVVGAAEKALSEDEGVAGVKQQDNRTSRARRFINRPSRTPSRGRSANSAHSSPHSARRINTQHADNSTSSSSPPAESTHSRHLTAAAAGDDYSLSNLALPPVSPNASTVTIEDVGSTSSSDHIAHIQLSPLQIMTNSATPATELRPPANGSAALDVGEAHPADTEVNAEAGTANFGVQVAISDKKKCEDETIQRPRSPCYGSPLTSPRPAASPKHQSPRLSTSSSSDNPRPTTADSESDTKLAQNSSLTVKQRLTSTSSNESPTTNKKLIPSVSVSVKQNLSELQFNGGPKKTSSSKLKKPRTTATPAPATECTAKFTRSAGRLSTAEESDTHVLANKATKPLPRPRTSATIKSSKSKSTNDLKPASSDSSPGKPELSPVNGVTPASPLEDRDKSSKRKSNLNRSLNEEATVDSVINLKYLLLTAKIRKNKLFLNDSLAARRRRRRELGMVRQLVPPDDPVLREMLSPRQNKTDTSAKNLASHKPPHNELAYHMEIARRGWDLVNPSVSNRARSETASPKYELHARESLIRERPSSNRLARRSDTLHLGELRKLRSNDVNRKVNERTKTDLAEIKKIAEQANVEMAMMASGIAADLAAQAVRGGEDYISNDLDGRDSNECIVELATPARYGIGSRQQALTPPPAPSYTELEVAAEAKERDPSPAKHATFVQEERIYYEPEADELVAKSISNTTMSGGILRQRILKARSMERDAGHEPPKLSPILRRRSTDDPTYIPVPTGAAGVYSTSPSTSTHNHIVSILKKKDHIAGESSSASSNASPVTFSANVVDTPTSKQKRAGILKKRSSLDESRYYSRSHSPDERSILIKSARRNSLEETAGLQQQQQHGILKQSSYESSKSDGCPSATEPHPHGILKKKDSTSTPSDGGTHAPKHVSISQAVKMAAAELGRETADNQAIAGGEHDESGYTPSNEEYEIRPILKLESISSDDAMRPPKPILKKKSSGDSDEYEIRPILKTSRKSSREEFDLGGAISEDGRHYSEPPPPIVRPILKTDSPSKRRSLGGEELEPDVFSAEQVSGQSPSLLKRRTRSLERQEVPVVDLAAALNAIATSQAAPLEFVSTPITTGGSISVAERIKNMEMFLSSNGTSPSTPVDANTSWESPLQSGVTPKLFKPSAIRRDMYRDRYKTQPITNDEKLHFKATASPLDTSTTSAFKPTKSLDAGLNYNTFAHLNAPTAASSVSPGSSYTLTRCATQPLHSQHHFKAAETSSSSGTPPPPLPTLRATIGRHNSLSDSYSNANNNNHNNSISEQLNLSAGSDSERIFEMSGIEEAPIESAGKVEGGADAAGAGAGLTRKNSVRARANMFQQLQQEKTRSAEATSALAGTALGREERTSPRRGSSQLSPTTSMLPTIAPIMSSSISSTSGLHTNSHEEPKTPQNPIRTDEEIEPTSLPVSERLRFFTNLTEAASRSASSSYTRSPSQRFLTATDRCGSANSFSHNNSFTFTSRSSYNGDSTSTSSASASVTPTPMECCSPPLTEQQQLISINEIDSPLQLDSARHSPSPPPSIGLPNVTQQASSTYIHLTKSSSQTLLPSVLAQRLAMSAPAPTATAAALTTSPSSLTPVARRIKMKTIGKLLLPNTFLNNERNSLQNFSSNTSENGVSVNSAQSDTCESESGSYIEADNKAPPAPLKKIGKIKSPFIENCLQMQQKHHQLNSKCMKYDHKSTPHNALAALENNGSNGNGGGGGGERDINSLPPRKPLQNGNAGLPPPPRIETTEDSKADSGKENNYCDTNAAPLLTLSPTASSIALSEQLSQSPVVEMRKKFTRIMSSATLSTVAQRHTAHALSNGNGNNNGNAQANGNSASSAPTTPRNSIIDDKFAKYFGLTTGGNQPAAATATTNKATNGNQRTARAQESLNTATARSVGASETSLSSRSATNYPPLPPPDFAGTPNGDLHASVKKLTDALSFAKEINTSSATPHEAFNHNVRSNSNTPYFTPPSVCAYDITLTQTSSATGTASAGGSASTGVSASAVQRRRDMSKRQRANTTNITFTPTSSNTQLFSAQANADTPSSGRTRALRSRALTLTHGVPLPEVKRFEDIVVTKEEFQLASKEFERIFLGVI